MDTPRVIDYKTRINASFGRATHSCFVDYRHASDLAKDMYEILEDAEIEFAAPEDRWELFDVVNYIFLKWGKTQMDDSAGHTQSVMFDILKLWEKVLLACDCDADEQKMMLFFMKYSQGHVLDYLEEYLLDFLDQHFKSPSQLNEKKDFFEARIQECQHLEFV